jgi:hypothetical protein
LILIYLLTAVGLTPGGSCTVHIYTQTVHRTQITERISITPENSPAIFVLPSTLFQKL